MHLTFLRTWRGYVEGRTYDVPEGAAQIHLASGRATIAKNPASVTLDSSKTFRPLPTPAKPKSNRIKRSRK